MEYIECDIKNLEKFINKNKLNLEILEDLKFKESNVKYIAEGGIIKGFGAIWRDSLRPLNKNIYIEILKPYRRAGLGTKLFYELTKNERVIFANIDASDKIGSLFLKSLGFYLIKQIAKCIIEPKDLSALFIPYGEEPEIMKISELTKESTDVLLSMLLIDFNRINKHNPTDMTLQFDEWKNHITKDLLYWDSYFDYKNGTIYSYALSYKTDDVKTVELKFTQTTSRDMRYGKFLAEIIRLLFRSYKYIKIDFDSRDLSKGELKKILKINPYKVSNVYIRS